MADARVYIDVRDSQGYTGELEKLRRDEFLHFNTVLAFTKQKLQQLKKRVFMYLLGEYLHILTDKGLTMKYKTCSIVNRKTFLAEH